MALYEYFCDRCSHRFEELTSSDQTDLGKCPKCHEKARKLISAFKVGGRGDLRESTMHGCHDCSVPMGSSENGGSSGDGGGGHQCGSGCSH